MFRLFTFAAVLTAFVAGPALAAPSIQVTTLAALEGTYGLEVFMDATGGKAYVQSDHAVDERTLRVDLLLSANAIVMCPDGQGGAVGGNGCRFAFFRALGNRSGAWETPFYIILKKNNLGSYKVLLWVRDETSGNPGKLEGVDGFFLDTASSSHKVTVEWTAATDGNSDGEVKIYKDDVLKNTVSNLTNPYEVDAMRLGHLNGSERSAANGTVKVDSFAATRF